MKLATKIFLFITFPIWCVPVLFFLLVKIIWDEISEFTENY